MFDDNTGNLAYSLYAVTESGMPDCLVDTNDYRCIPWDETPGGVYWWDQDDNGSDTSGICYGASTRPVAPTSIDIPDWLSWVGNWLSYGIEYIVRYFAWCPWHTSAIIGMGQTFRSKDPIASIIEIDQVLTEVQTQLTGYNWSDSDQNETGLIVSSEGGAESAEATSTSLLDRIFPTGSSPWNGGPLITGLQEWTGNSHYDNCVSNYGELLDNEGLTAGTCFVSSAMDLIGVSFLFQLMLELAAVAFLINDFIAQIKNTASFMSGGSMQGAQYGEGPYADHTYDD